MSEPEPGQGPNSLDSFHDSYPIVINVTTEPKQEELLPIQSAMNNDESEQGDQKNLPNLEDQVGGPTRNSSAKSQAITSKETPPDLSNQSLPPIHQVRFNSTPRSSRLQELSAEALVSETGNKNNHTKMNGYQTPNLPGTIDDDLLPIDAMQYRGSKAGLQGFQKYPVIKKTSELGETPEKIEDATHMFRDNKRSVDFVLAFEDGSPKDEHRRKMFQKNLVEEGLELEVEDKEESECGKIYYVKVHTPWDLLVRYAEILKLKKPIKGFIMIRGGQVWEKQGKSRKKDIFSWLGIKNPFNYSEELIPPEPEVFSAGFSFNRQDISTNLNSDGNLTPPPPLCRRNSLFPPPRDSRSDSLTNLITYVHAQELSGFLIKDREAFFTQSQRHLIVWEILKRVPYSSKDLGFGINRLLAKKTYLAAYPLHDGPYERDIEGEKQCERRLLYLEWVHPSKFYKKQPLHLIRRYFGDKMALYFAWLGFYTTMLIPAAIMGIITFIGGLFLTNSSYNKPSEEICNPKGTGNMTMCPMCDRVCNFWSLKDSCFTSKIAFLFDNPMTVVFAIAMSFWATMFLELWKRKQVVLQRQWDMERYEDEEELRPEYEESVRTTKVNPVTNKVEPFLPFWNKCSRGIAAYSLVFFMLLLVMTAVLGVILYRLLVAAVMYKTNDEFITKNAKLVTSGTAAFLNLLVIIILNYFYEKLVKFLTSLEMPRTQTEYEDSFTLKMFLFQFINYYSSLIYIAFFKGRFFYHPGDPEARNSLILAVRYDMCDPAGCLFELCVQLAIIMVGKQFFNNVMEIVYPILKVWWNKRGNKEGQRQTYTRWEQDYDLAEYNRLSLFNEYLEMVIQYGFVTLFVAAFPLAPFFALANNVIEIRLDAYKYVTKSRRPLPYRVQDIGIWYNILKAITYISVLTNALVISYTSDFIPRLVYWFAYTEDNLHGYIKNSLSIFSVSDYNETLGPDKSIFKDTQWPETCYYRAYRTPPDDEQPYQLTLQFYHVFTARLWFILIFEHVIFITTGIISWAIPDVPVEVKNQIMMEKKVEKDALFEAEMRTIKEERQKFLREQGLHTSDLDLGDGTRTPSTASHSRAPSRNNTRDPDNSEMNIQDADS